jgi:hypothetical protein
MEYTHNLKIILVDDNNNIIEDKVILNEIKDILSRNNTHKIEWNNKLLDVTIKWEKKELSEISQILMGDLFSHPIYEYDSIILDHTQKTINKIDCRYKYFIRFYISRIIYDKIIDKNSVDFV